MYLSQNMYMYVHKVGQLPVTDSLYEHNNSIFFYFWLKVRKNGPI